MTRKFVNPDGTEHTIRCSRCRKVCQSMTGWNAAYSKGYLTGFLCPTCQTPGENAEAEINEATVDYSSAKSDAVGRTHVKAKS